MYRTVSGVVPIDIGHGTPGSTLLQSPDVRHAPPEPIQDPGGAVTQPLLIFGSSGHPESRARQLSDAEWRDLKPLLHELYIKENKTLNAIRKALQERCGLRLSQKQLTKRFAEWNFKKNVKQHETGAFLSKAEPLLGEAEASVDGVRVTAAKCERWAKRAKVLDEEQKSTRTKDVVSTFNTPSNVTGQTPLSCTPTTNSPSTLRHEDSSDMSIVSPSMLPADQAESFTRRGSAGNRLPPSLTVPPAKTTSFGVSSSTLSVGSLEPLESPPSAHASLGTVEESELDPTWSISLESPDHDTKTLTRLFSALKMNPRDISYNPPAQPSAKVSTLMLDTVSLENIETRGFHDQLVPWASKQAAICKPASSGSIEDISRRSEETPQQATIILVSHQYGSRKRTTTGALKYPFADVILSSSEVVEPNPFSLEVYPFPREQGRYLEVQPTSTRHNVLCKNLKECMLKINKLESAALGSNTAATTLRRKLAIAYFELGHYEKAEHEFKQILQALEEQHEQYSHYVASVKADLAEATLYLGRFQEANQMAQYLHSLARRRNPGGALYQRATQVLARSFGYLGDLTREEELLRELIQIRLNAFGPKHGDTIAAIRTLSYSIVTAERHLEGEELMRVALELSSNATHFSDQRRCLIYIELGITLYKQGKYADSEALLRKTAKMSEELLGIEHRDTLQCKFWLCRVLTARKLLSESHDILLKTVEIEIKTREELSGGTIEAMPTQSQIEAITDLIILMIEMRKLDDAYKWMKRALHYSVKAGVIKSVHAARFFKDLSSINEPEQKHELVTALYKSMAQTVIWGPNSMN